MKVSLDKDMRLLSTQLFMMLIAHDQVHWRQIRKTKKKIHLHSYAMITLINYPHVHILMLKYKSKSPLNWLRQSQDLSNTKGIKGNSKLLSKLLNLEELLIPNPYETN